jgi:hypothetical protein
MSDESDTYELEGTLENARYWHRRAEEAELRLAAAEEHEAYLLSIITQDGGVTHDWYKKAKRYEKALLDGRCMQCGSWFRDMPAARAALSPTTDRTEEA